MKKKFFLVGVIAMFGLSAFLVSCDKDDDSTPPTCKCKITDTYYDYSETVKVDLSDPKNVEKRLDDEFDIDVASDVKKGKIKNCQQLEDAVKDEMKGWGVKVSCEVD